MNITNGMVGKILQANPKNLGWWFSLTCLECSPLFLGEMIQCDEHIFQMGWFNHQVGEKILINIATQNYNAIVEARDTF